MAFKSSVLRRFHVSHAVSLLLLFSGILFPERLTDIISAFNHGIITYFGWFIMLCSAGFVFIAGYLAFSRYGLIRLGKADDTPAYNTFSWLCMLFAAGMGTGLVFYGAAEPLIHFLQPPPAGEHADSSIEAARYAMATTYFHWGVHAWAIYALAALSIGYFSYRYDRPLLPSAPFAMHGWRSNIINTMAIIAVVFGIVATLAQGLLQLSAGINYLLPDMPYSSRAIQLSLLIILSFAYILSASTSLGKGIKYLSNTNILFAMLLLCFVLLNSATVFIMEGFVSAIGDYIDNFIKLSFNMRHYADKENWLGGWTITYLMWWIAWAPFVGVFIARISKGRTLREFMLGVILVPSVFSAFWFATFGGAALYEEIILASGFAEVIDKPYQTTFALLQTFPFSRETTIFTLLLLCMFIITSADSGTYVLGMFSCHGQENPAVRDRLFWGIIIGLITMGALMSGGGTEFFRSIAVLGGVFYLLIMIWQVIYLLIVLKRDVSLFPNN